VHSFYIKNRFKPKRYKKQVTVYAALVCNDCFCVKHNHTEFLSYIWTVIADNFVDWYKRSDFYECNDVEKCKEFLKPFQSKIRWWQRRIGRILEPYNVKIDWQPLIDDNGNISHFETLYPSLSFPILRELVKKPELLVSAVLSSDSHFYTGSSSIVNGLPTTKERKGYVLFVAE
jgi:hypothetical protein